MDVYDMRGQMFMADFNINLSTLASKETELTGLSSDANSIYNDFSSSTLNNLSSTEISSLSSNISKSFTRLKNGYNNSSTWYQKYVKGINSIEDALASLSGDGLTTPTEFKGEFVDLFGKKVMPVLKTGATAEEKAIKLSDTPTGDGTIDLQLLGNDYVIANTDASLMEYYKNVILNQNLFQSSDKAYGDQCLGFSYNYAYGLYTNDRSISGKTCRNDTSYGNYFKEFKTNDEREYLNKIYDEISAGRPVVVQVIGSRSKQTRHYVAAVGFNKNVKSASDLKSTDLLIMDVYDGQIKNVVPYGASSGRYIASGRQINKGRYNYGYDMFYINDTKRSV